jgi:hypothetical protein
VIFPGFKTNRARMNRLGRYAFYWLAASAVLALISRSALMRRTPVRLLTAAAPLLHLPAPKKRGSASRRRRSTRSK